jgi:hypothetical protein
MSDKDRRKKDGQNTDKKNQNMREAVAERKEESGKGQGNNSKDSRATS